MKFFLFILYYEISNVEYVFRFALFNKSIYSIPHLANHIAYSTFVFKINNYLTEHYLYDFTSYLK